MIPHVQHPPAVGSAATWSNGRDSWPATVIAVSRTGHRVTIREDKAIVISGSEHDGSAQYRYEPDPNGREIIFTRRSERGGVAYRQEGSRWTAVSFGRRRAYRDPSF